MSNFLANIIYHPDFPSRARRAAKALIVGVIVLIAVAMLVFDHEPDMFSVVDRAVERAGDAQHLRVTGYVQTSTLIELIDIMLTKRGGYLSNDIGPPGVLMDNVPNWEFGVLVQIRDLISVFRNDYSRSQSQSSENPFLIEADNRIRIDSEKWMFPAAESEYRSAASALTKYRDGLVVKTPRLQVDDVFYEARGGTWALVHLLRAVEHDFSSVLEKKNALVSLRQIIRELEGCQDPIWSPIILNGKGFGFVANHSLVMASYISRANAAVIDLKSLLERG